MNKGSDANQRGSSPRPGQMSNPGHGPQGIDKAPGEETAQDTEQFKQNTQQGKKVDADLSKESDRPLEQPGR